MSYDDASQTPHSSSMHKIHFRGNRSRRRRKLFDTKGQDASYLSQYRLSWDFQFKQNKTGKNILREPKGSKRFGKNMFKVKLNNLSLITKERLSRSKIFYQLYQRKNLKNGTSERAKPLVSRLVIRKDTFKSKRPLQKRTRIDFGKLATESFKRPKSVKEVEDGRKGEQVEPPYNPHGSIIKVKEEGAESTKNRSLIHSTAGKKTLITQPSSHNQEFFRSRTFDKYGKFQPMFTLEELNSLAGAELDQAYGFGLHPTENIAQNSQINSSKILGLGRKGMAYGGVYEAGKRGERSKRRDSLGSDISLIFSKRLRSAYAQRQNKVMERYRRKQRIERREERLRKKREVYSRPTSLGYLIHGSDKQFELL